MKENSLSKERTETSNADPITGEPGAHPVATGAGTTAGGLAGATVGSLIGGPVGGLVGTVIGGIAGAYGGKAVGETIDPTVEDAYWRENHAKQPYADSPYADYAPAYRSGYQGYANYSTELPTFEEAERSVRADYEAKKPQVSWAKARPASQSAWNRVHALQARAAAEDLSDGPGTGGNV